MFVFINASFYATLIPMLVFHFIWMDKGEYFDKKKQRKASSGHIHEWQDENNICQLQHVLDLCSSWGQATLFLEIHISIKGTCLAKSQCFCQQNEDVINIMLDN